MCSYSITLIWHTEISRRHVAISGLLWLGPINAQEYAVDNQVVVQLCHGLFSCIASGELDEGTATCRVHFHWMNLAVVIKVVAQILFWNTCVNIANIDCLNISVCRCLWCIGVQFFENLLSHGVVGAVISVFNVLIGQFVVLFGLFVAIRTAVTTRARALQEERANVGFVALVVRRGSRKFLSHGHVLYFVKGQLSRCHQCFVLLRDIITANNWLWHRCWLATAQRCITHLCRQICRYVSIEGVLIFRTY